MGQTAQRNKSSVQSAIDSAQPTSPRHALAIEIHFNLQYQHNWRNLCIHPLSDTSTTVYPMLDPPRTSNGEFTDEDETYLISGQPPRHSYIHPDFQARLLKHSIAETDVPVQREWVLPLSVGETCTLKRFDTVFEALPKREQVEVPGQEMLKWQDVKRVVLGMLAHNGMGGDGTVTYYIMQEGEVKPRQNG